MLKEIRKKELPPVDNALLINLQLLFSVADQIDIDSTEKEEVDEIIHQNDKELYLTTAIDNYFWYGNQGIIEKTGSFKKRVLTIPASYVNDNSKIVVTHCGKEDTIYEDWSISSVERPKNSVDVDKFKVSYKSKTIDDAPIRDGDTIIVQIYPYEEDFEPMELKFIAHENKIAMVRTGFDYELLE